MAERLPIYDIEDRIIASLRKGSRLILSAPTGSGKSTQVPQMLLRHGLLDTALASGDRPSATPGGQVVILQPRRLAARLLAARVAHELGVGLGRDVGYQIRFENVTSPQTRIRYVTEGVLLRQMLQDPQLTGVSALVFDEFHERHLYGDITLARSLDIQESTRPDLRILVMSATLDSDLLARYLGEVRMRPRSAPEIQAAPSYSDAAVSPHPDPLPEEREQQEWASRTKDVRRAEGRASSLPLPKGEGRGEGEEGALNAGAHEIHNDALPSICTVLSSDGRMFPVEIRYADAASWEARQPIWELAADAFADYVQSGGEGDVLVFMPGGFEISQSLDAIRHRKASDGFILLPLHGELNPRDQDAAVARYDQRKVVVSTNVAETSLTIDGVRLVIDSGLARIPRFDPHRGINTLLIEKISQASADQRAGRAGRTAPGVCWRLWSEAEHSDRPVQEKPEVQRLDLAEVVLTLKAAGVEDLHAFRWLEHPGDLRLAHAEELLVDLGALKPAAPVGDRGRPVPEDSDGHRAPLQITELGRRMLAFPLHPRYARMLLAAQELGCVYQACLMAALTQGRDLLVRKVEKRSREFREDMLGDKAPSDFFHLMRAWSFAAKNDFRLDACKRMGVHAVTARQVGPLLQQFLRIAEREGLDVKPKPVDDAIMQKCLLIGFSDRVARRLDTGTLRCELVHDRRGVLARESAVQDAELFVAAEVREIGGHEGDVKTILSLATAIQQAWLEEFFPDDLTREMEVFYDSQAKRVYAEELQCFRGLELTAKKIEPPPLDQAAKLLAEQVLAAKLVLHDWDHAVEQWIVRLNCLAQWCPEFELPPIGPDDRRALAEQLCHGKFSYKDIKDAPVKPLVKAWLNDSQKDLLDKHAPERLNLPNDKRPKVTYGEDAPPFLAVRIQELFGITETPKIALGRVPVLVHILAPNMRPVQITQDLASFWREQYPKVKSELQRKYPKHEWR
jgi:ATP-dependent helicase HrpB